VAGVSAFLRESGGSVFSNAHRGLGLRRHLSTVRLLNLGLKFVLEITALACLGIWGATIAHGPAAVILAIGLPLLTAVLWGTFAAPKARRRLPLRLRVPFELSVFAVAAVALWRSESATPAVTFAGLVLLNALLLTALGQWEE
jgi:hypothetical protein